MHGRLVAVLVVDAVMVLIAAVDRSGLGFPDGALTPRDRFRDGALAAVIGGWVVAALVAALPWGPRRLRAAVAASATAALGWVAIELYATTLDHGGGG